MPTVNLTFTLAGGQAENINQVQQNFVDLRTGINGNLDGDNLTAAARAALGLSSTGTVRRGSSIILSSEAIAGTSFAALTTPDRVSNVVVPSNGLLLVSFRAVGTKTAGGSGESWGVSIYINGVQGRSRHGSATGSPSSSNGNFEQGNLSAGFGVTFTSMVYTDPTQSNGFGIEQSGSGGLSDEPTVGMAGALFVPFVINAGTYTVEVRFNKTAGATVGVTNRRLYVESRGY